MFYAQKFKVYKALLEFNQNAWKSYYKQNKIQLRPKAPAYVSQYLISDKQIFGRMCPNGH